MNRREPDPTTGFRVPRQTVGKFSIRYKVGVALLSLGALLLAIIGLTYQTFQDVGSDNERKELSRAQESSVFRIQLLAVRLLRGERLEEEIVAENEQFEGRQRILFARTDDELLAAGPTRAQRTWEAYRDSCRAVIDCDQRLAEGADAAQQRFAPWLASLSALEPAINPDRENYEDLLGLISSCRAASSVLHGAFLKLVSAPPGDAERQARLSLSVTTEIMSNALENLHEGFLDAQAVPPRSTPGLERLAECKAIWNLLSSDLDVVVRDKVKLLELVGPSNGVSLVDCFESMIEAQQDASRLYDESAADRRRLLTRILAASAVIVIALIAILMIGVRRFVVDPILRLTAGTIHLSRGALDTRIDVDTRDELGLLAHSFNSMAESLAESRQQLRAWAETLEEQVRTRTDDLRAANEKLIEESEQRERIEGELRMVQKLESVGRLAAGIAHEINTPIQFINDNTRFLGSAFADSMPVLVNAKAVAERVRDGLATTKDAEELLAEIEAADVDYLVAETQSAIEQSLDGIERVTRIVRAMKEFSHPGSDEKTCIDLNRAIESTVTVASNEWKYVAELEMNLDPGLPPVSCLPGEINQVILNMIVNAAHAIEDVVSRTPKGRGKIRVSTSQEGGDAVVRISDTGSGIPAEIRDKIFDQFFTTKDVGRGTGQGLSIAHGVVVGKHGGTIDLESEVGKGTTFIVRLPLQASALEGALVG